MERAWEEMKGKIGCGGEEEEEEEEKRKTSMEWDTNKVGEGIK